MKQRRQTIGDVRAVLALTYEKLHICESELAVERNARTRAEETLTRVAAQKDALEVVQLREETRAKTMAEKVLEAEKAEALARDRADLMALHFNVLGIVAATLAKKVSP